MPLTGHAQNGEPRVAAAGDTHRWPGSREIGVVPVGPSHAESRARQRGHPASGWDRRVRLDGRVAMTAKSDRECSPV